MRSRVSVLAAIFLIGCSRSQPPVITVSVAASLQDAVKQIGPAFEQSRPGTRVQFNFGGSGTLERQIEQGAPVDVFLSAASGPMDELAKNGLIDPTTRYNLLRNDVVLIAPAGSKHPDSFEDLAQSAVKLIALGDPGSVPAGDYGRQVLEKMQLWPAVQKKLVLAKDVRQVLTYVETGEADAGIVYSTDARLSSRVRVAAAAPETSHQPVIYPVAVVKNTHNSTAARAFASYLNGPEARRTFTRLGFSTVSP